MPTKIIIVVGENGPNWEILDKEFNSCPDSPQYYSNIISHPKEEYEECDNNPILCKSLIDPESEIEGEAIKIEDHD